MEQMKKSEREERMAEMRGKVLLGVPMERVISQHAFFHFIAIANRGWQFALLPYCRNDIARNKFAAAAMRAGADWLVMLDSDHKHPPDVVERLLRWTLERPDIRVVGGLNFRRGKPYDPCAFVRGDGGEVYSIVDWEPGLIEVDALGTGSIAIHTSVFDEIEFPWFGYSYEFTNHVDDGWPGTDIFFCDRLAEAGIKMYVDTTTTSPHLIDNQVVTEQTYRSWLQANQDRVAASVGYSTVKGTGDGHTVSPIGERCEAEIDRLLSEGDTILELGSGEGTGRLAQRYRMISVEHDPEYVGRHNSQYIQAAIVPNGSHDWYDAGILERELPPDGYDLLLVDGPPGHVGRLGMLQHLDLFDLDATIVVDDVHRNADRYLLTELAKVAGRDYRIVHEDDGRRAVGIIE